MEDMEIVALTIFTQARHGKVGMRVKVRKLCMVDITSV
jgi:hypothetical protein